MGHIACIACSDRHHPHPVSFPNLVHLRSDFVHNTDRIISGSKRERGEIGVASLAHHQIRICNAGGLDPNTDMSAVRFGKGAMDELEDRRRSEFGDNDFFVRQSCVFSQGNSSFLGLESVFRTEMVFYREDDPLETDRHRSGAASGCHHLTGSDTIRIGFVRPLTRIWAGAAIWAFLRVRVLPDGVGDGGGLPV